MSTGSLVVAGSGISAPAQTSTEAVAAIRDADRVLLLAAEPLSQLWVSELNPNVEILNRFYEVGLDRSTTYERMVECVLAAVRSGARTCMVLYGHPGTFAYPAHEAVRRARAEGFRATMQPGISAADCLVADLGYDPGVSGYQGFEATDFLLYRRAFDPRSVLVLWQIGVIGVQSVLPDPLVWNLTGVELLAETLAAVYGAEHEVVVYEAARYPVVPPSIVRTPLRDLAKARIAVVSTLFVPPLPTGPGDPEMRRRLGLDDRLASTAGAG